jgi:hypothetical protein
MTFGVTPDHGSAPMTEMMSGVNDEDVNAEVVPPGLDGLDEQLINQLVDWAKAGGLQLTGEGGVLQIGHTDGLVELLGFG